MINVCILAGNLCKDVEVKKFGDVEIANTSLAINEGYGDNKKTHYANIVAYGEMGKNMAKILSKGSKVSFECKYTQYVGEKDGKKTYTTQFVVTKFVALGGGKNTSNSGVSSNEVVVDLGNNSNNQNNANINDDFPIDDDLPFDFDL